MSYESPSTAELFGDLAWPITVGGGGELHDESFFAGYVCGAVATILVSRDKPQKTKEYRVFAGVVPQLDLIAMACGYSMHSKQETDKIVVVHFTRDS